MQRKLACCITVVITVFLMIYRVAGEMVPGITMAGLPLADFLIVFTLISLAGVTVLSLSRKAPVVPLERAPQPLFGWFMTLCGALLIMSVVLDAFCWLVYDKTPPPNSSIVNSADLYTLIFSLIFGMLAGLFFVIRGFCWMSKSQANQTIMNWMALTPIVWMWLRLARYEISNASTIDLSASFFDLATLITGSLFFLQLARLLTGIGKPPRNMLFIFSLFTAICSFSSLPYAVYKLFNNTSIESMMIVITDATFGLLALSVALIQAFVTTDNSVDEKHEPDATPQDESVFEAEESDSLAWTTPAKEREPLDPPFSLDEKLPDLTQQSSSENIVFTQNTTENDAPAQDEFSTQDTSQETVTNESFCVSQTSSGWTVDDILSELNKQ